MAIRGFGLRAKSMLALLLACVLTLLPAATIGWQVLEAVRAHFGEAYVRNYTQLSAQQLLAPIQRELTLAIRMSDAVLLREWLLDESDPLKRAQAFREIEGFRKDFREQSYFIASLNSLGFYLNQPDMEYSVIPRYVINPQSHEDAWFFSTLESSNHFNINVNPDRLGFTKVWFNVVVRDNDHVLGIAGSGLDLTNFIDEFIKADEAGITPIIIDTQGAIQAHPDTRLISYGAGSGSARDISLLEELLGTKQQRDELKSAMQRTKINPATVQSFWVTLDGRRQLMALTHIPELSWHLVTTVDLEQINILRDGWFWAAIAAFTALLLFLLGTFALAVERMVLRPVRQLQQSATALAQGNYEVSLPPSGRDELGDLSRAFGVMANQIKNHTEELEGKVQDRTQQLEQANREMAASQKKITDSIDYASLIQRALLPDKQMGQVLGEHHFILWHPRDVVGGDFYLFRAEQERYLLGIVDCAGHGVPGALMTMLARAAFDDAMNRIGLDSPAALLSHADATLREMLKHSELPRAIATNMDAGLACVDRSTKILRYAGAKIALYWSDGEEVGEFHGGRRPLFDRKIGHYEDHEITMHAGVTYYLATDGYLDQAGGELGFGFGNTRFAQLLKEHARLPMTQQASALERAIHEYRGEHPQRDDITILSFRID